MISKINKVLKPPVVSKFVKLSRAGNAGLISFDNKDSTNVVNYEMTSATYSVLKEIESKYKLVVFKGSSEGTALKELGSFSPEVVKDRFRNDYRSFHLIGTYNLPTVAIFNESTACSPVLAAKYQVATTNAVFTAKGPEIGFFTDSGASFYLSRLRKHFGIYLAMTGASIKGSYWPKVGLATHFVEMQNLPDLEQTLVLCKTDDQVKDVLEGFAPVPLGCEMEMDEKLEKIEKCFSGLTVEQVLYNLKNDGSEWALDAINRIRSMSPTSLKICHRLLSVGRHMCMEDCAKLEWRLAVQLASDIDFDSAGNWTPATIEDVSDGQLARFFGPLHDGDELTFEIKRCSKGFHVE